MSDSVRPHRRQPTRLPVPGTHQARTLEWVAISLSNAGKWKVKVKSLSCVQLLVTPWTAAYQAPPSMGFSRQEYWSGVPLCISAIKFFLLGVFILTFGKRKSVFRVSIIFNVCLIFSLLPIVSGSWGWLVSAFLWTFDRKECKHLDSISPFQNLGRLCFKVVEVLIK